VFRQEACQFVDDRLSPAEKAGFVHGLLRRDMGEVRMCSRAHRALFAALTESERNEPVVLRGARQDRTRRRRARPYLRFAEDADQPQIRARMIQLAGTLAGCPQRTSAPS